MMSSCGSTCLRVGYMQQANICRYVYVDVRCLKPVIGAEPDKMNYMHTETNLASGQC